ncbi:MAG: asparagine synthase C-terminal domain-containing protein [archaeon]|nr:MAG: asparagine synthase C-terminal domain-containing protein [archaeon]
MKTMGEEKISSYLIELIKKAIKKRIPKHKFGLLFSGGLDSSIIAAILKKNKCDFTSYVVEITNPNFKASDDVFFAKKLARDLNLTLKIIQIKEEEIESNLKKILNLLKDDHVVKASIAIPLYFCFKKLEEDGCKSVFYGGGCDAIFAGFERHRKAKNINKECLSCIKECNQKIESREKILARNNKLKLITPFLDKEIIDFSLKIPGKYKIKEGIEKHILRKAASKLGLPDYITKRKKRAIQYSSNCQKALKKLAKKKGFKKIKDYFKTQINKF